MNTHVFMTLTPFLRHHLLTVAPLLWSASFVPGRPLSLREPGRPWGPAKPCRICGSITCAPPPSRPGRWRRSTRQLAERKKMTKSHCWDTPRLGLAMRSGVQFVVVWAQACGGPIWQAKDELCCGVTRSTMECLWECWLCFVFRCEMMCSPALQRQGGGRGCGGGGRGG